MTGRAASLGLCCLCALERRQLRRAGSPVASLIVFSQRVLHRISRTSVACLQHLHWLEAFLVVDIGPTIKDVKVRSHGRCCLHSGASAQRPLPATQKWRHSCGPGVQAAASGDPHQGP